MEYEIMMTKAKQNRPRRAQSLTNILATRIAILIFVVIATYAVFSVYNAYTAYRQSLTAQQQQIAQDASKTVSSFIQDKFNALQTAATVTNPVGVSVDAQKNMMESLLAQDSAFRQFALLDNQGQQLSQASRTSQTLSAQFITYLKGDALTQTAASQKYVSQVYVDDVTSEPLIAIAIPVKNVFGDFQGTLVGEVNLKFMWDLVDQLKVGQTGYAYVVNNQGNLIAFGDTSRVLAGENVKQIGEVKEFVDNPSLTADITPGISSYSGLLGQTVEGTYAPLGTPQWAVVTELPTSESNQPILRLMLLNGIAVLTATFLGGWAGFLLARLITAPMVDLSAVATQIANGDVAVEANVVGVAEIANMASAFNAMTSRLREFISSLESRVAERTQSLELAAEVGRSISQVRDLDVMLKDAAELIRSRFNLYYVQVYLTNPAQNLLLLQAGTGTVGTELVEQGHHLPLDTTSINGRAAVEKHSVVISDTTINKRASLYLLSHSRHINKKDIEDTASSEGFRPNPLLPDTRSEMAIPLIVDEKVVGVLDLQNNRRDSLNQDNLPGFEALAGQLAIAIQNANLLAETNQARAEVEAQARRLTRANWVDYMDAIHQPEEIGYVFNQNKIVPMNQAEQIQINDNALTVPISVTGESLGNLVVEMEGQSPIARTDELLNTVARQVAQQIESLRLLDSAERYRAEAEQASRRLTHEGWKEYMQTNMMDEGLSYLYDLNEVRPFNPNKDAQTEESAFSLPLKVRDATVGKLIVQGLESDDKDALELVDAVAERLGTHIESLRLSMKTEEALATTQKFAQREQSLRQITSAVRGSTDPATILRTAVRELGAILGRKTVIRLETANKTQTIPAHRPTDLAQETVANNGHEPDSSADHTISAVGGNE
jgi:GAF domain-containing protein/HAMP domain-containing protein